MRVIPHNTTLLKGVEGNFVQSLCNYRGYAGDETHVAPKDRGEETDRTLGMQVKKFTETVQGLWVPRVPRLRLEPR